MLTLASRYHSLVVGAEKSSQRRKVCSQVKDIRHVQGSFAKQLRCHSSGPNEATARFAGVRADLVPREAVLLPGEIDTESMISEADFSIPPDELILLCKAFLRDQIDHAAGKLTDEEFKKWFAPDFRFVAPVVGPLSSDRLISSVAAFRLTEAFPDLS